MKKTCETCKYSKFKHGYGFKCNPIRMRSSISVWAHKADEASRDRFDDMIDRLDLDIFFTKPIQCGFWEGR